MSFDWIQGEENFARYWHSPRDKWLEWSSVLGLHRTRKDWHSAYITFSSRSLWRVTLVLIENRFQRPRFHDTRHQSYLSMASFWLHKRYYYLALYFINCKLYSVPYIRWRDAFHRGGPWNDHGANWNNKISRRKNYQRHKVLVLSRRACVGRLSVYDRNRWCKGLAQDNNLNLQRYTFQFWREFWIWVWTIIGPIYWRFFTWRRSSLDGGWDTSNETRHFDYGIDVWYTFTRKTRRTRS